LTACSKFEPVSKGGDENVPVELYGEIYTGAATRGDGVINGVVPTGGLVFDLYRADQTGDPAGYDKYTLKVEGTLADDDTKKITTNPGLYYSGNGTKSSFIGVYPVGGVLNANTVTYDLDGSDDILATQNVDGNQEYPPTAALAFKHLLTKIRVDIKPKTGDDAGALVASGGITSIKVVGKAVKAVVALPNPTTNATGAYPTIAAGAALADSDLSLWTAAGLALTNNDAGAITFNPDGTPTTIGYAMFLPSEATEVLTLKIITKGAPTTVHSITLPTKPYVQGLGYIITIQFSKTKLGLDEFELDNVTADIDIWDDQTPEPDVVYE
jgi:hypothetical protein